MATKKQALVLDPIPDKTRQRWGRTSESVLSVEDLLQKAKQTQSKVLVVDESYLSLDKYDTSQAWLAKTSRHLGHNAIFIGQRLTDVSRGLRTQCDQVFVFRCTRKEAREIDDEFDEPMLLKCTKLKKFCFAWITPEGIKFGRVDPDTLKTYEIPLADAVVSIDEESEVENEDEVVK